MADLPEGRSGRALALLLAGLAAALLWAGAVAPLRQWYLDRADQIDRQAALVQRMARIVDELPSLRQRAAQAGQSAPVAVLAGDSDSVAGAALQQRLQQIGTDVGASIASAELLPGEKLGGYRRIGVRLSVSGTWPVVVRLVAAIDAGTPRMLINDLQVQSGRRVGESEPTVSSSMIVFGFRAGTAS